jgi:hypothetical protein
MTSQRWAAAMPESAFDDPDREQLARRVLKRVDNRMAVPADGVDWSELVSYMNREDRQALPEVVITLIETKDCPLRWDPEDKEVYFPRSYF